MSFLDNVREWFQDIVHHHDHIEVRIVKDGDTLWSIAKTATGATTDADVQRHVEEIKALNPQIINPDEIRRGDKINLPLHWDE